MNARELTRRSFDRLKVLRAAQERAPQSVQPFDEPPYRVPRWAHVGWRGRWRPVGRRNNNPRPKPADLP